MARRCGVIPLAALCAVAASAGCQWVGRPQFETAAARLRAIERDNRELTVRLNDVEAHRHELADQLRRTELSLGQYERQVEADRQQLANYRDERQRLASFMGSPQAMPFDLSGRLAELAREYPGLRYDPATGIAKLDADVLFPTGEAEIGPDGERLLAEFASLMQEPRNRDLKILVAGHTDNRRIKGRDVRDKYPSNWHLSAARSLEVIDYLHRRGIGDDRLALAGFGAHQPIVPNDSPDSQQRNRRVEILVVAPDARVVGWPETVPTLY